MKDKKILERAEDLFQMRNGAIVNVLEIVIIDEIINCKAVNEISFSILFSSGIGQDFNIKKSKSDEEIDAFLLEWINIREAYLNTRGLNILYYYTIEDIREKLKLSKE